MDLQSIPFNHSGIHPNLLGVRRSGLVACGGLLRVKSVPSSAATRSGVARTVIRTRVLPASARRRYWS